MCAPYCHIGYPKKKSFCLSGESRERHSCAYLQGRAKLQELSHLKEAEQLLRTMLTFKPKGRPSMRAVMAHPFWWPPAARLSFLIDMSDRMENEDREVSVGSMHCTSISQSYSFSSSQAHHCTMSVSGCVSAREEYMRNE